MKREKRIKKILTLREQELDQARATLAQANRALEAAKEATRQASLRAKAAKDRHDEMLRSGTLGVTGWSESEAWVLSEEKKIEVCAAAEFDAVAHVEECRALVLTAQNNVDRIQALLERIAKQEAQIANVKERKMDDEYARRASAKAASDE